MKKRENRSFDKAFKLMGLNSIKMENLAREISCDLDIPADTVWRWSREYSTSEGSGFAGNGNPVLTPEQQEITELKKAWKETQIERDILKKAISIFSKSDNNYSGS